MQRDGGNQNKGQSFTLLFILWTRSDLTNVSKSSPAVINIAWGNNIITNQAGQEATEQSLHPSCFFFSEKQNMQL